MKNVVSIIMTSYNYASYIEEAIKSVINQTYSNWELIIIDDCSKDNSVEIIEKYVKQDSRIKLIINNKNLGLAASLKKAISYAQYDWLAFLESDDIFYPDALEEKIKILPQNPDIVFSDVELFGAPDAINAIEEHLKGIKKFYIDLKESGFIENFRNIIPNINIIPTFSCAMVKKSLIENCKFKSVCKTYLDFYLWAQLREARVYYIHKKLTHWRMHSDSYTNKARNNRLKQLLFRIDIYSMIVKDKPAILRLFLILNFLRRNLITVTFSKKGIRFHIAQGKEPVAKVLQ